MKKYKSKVLNLYRKQKFLNLLSVKLLLPITALFLLTMAIVGISIAIFLQNFALGGVFAGLGLSLSIVSLTYLLVNGEDDYYFKRKLKYLSEDMEKTKEDSLFEKQMYDEVQTLIQQKEDYNQTKKLINEITKKLKQNKEELTEQETEKMKEEKASLVKQKSIIKQQEKEIKKIENQYIKKNLLVQKLNPELEVEYLGVEI